MNSSVGVLSGRQEPRVEQAPEGDTYHADTASFLAASYGLDPDPWQRRVLDAWLAERGDGRWAASRAGLAVPRQNGKNALLEVRELYGMVELGERFLHTAHEVKTARKAFLRLVGFVENRRKWPELNDLVKDIRKTNGQEAIVLHNGGSVEFVARSRGSGRGYTVDVLVFDEAQELTDEQLEALRPTISSGPAGNPQTILTGTPPPPGTSGEVFTRYRNAAIEGGDHRLAWHEWSVVGKVDINDMALWEATNPALGRRLHPDGIVDELADMSADGFARERLGSWELGTTGAEIAADVWASLEDGESRRDPKAKSAFTVDITPDRSATSIGYATDRRDRLRHVELIDHRSGTSWAIERLVELKAKWGGEVGLDPSSQAGSLLTGLQEAGVEPVLIGTRDATQACGLFVKMVVEDGTVRHRGQPKLNVAVDAGCKRMVGPEGGWCWNRRDSASDISPLVAVTNANFLLGIPSKRRERTGQAMFA